MLIVLEGIDGGGKTTLAQSLVKEAELRGWEGEVWHRGVPTRHPLEEYEKDIEEDYPWTAKDRARRLIVCDRWHMGQLTYGSLYTRDQKDFDLGCAWHVDALLQSLGAVQLILAPPVEVALERSFSRGEDYLKRGHFEYIWNAYRSMVSDDDHGALWDVGHGIFGRSVSFIDTATPLDDDEVRTLVDAANCRSQRCDALLPFKTYVGPRYPEVLLLGERHGGRPREEQADRHRVAFGPYAATSGRWLVQSIVNDSFLSGLSIGLANAKQEDVFALYHLLGHPNIVTLGGEAHREVQKYDLPHGQVPHPQYGRRFFHHRQKEYAAAIAEAIGTKGKVDPWHS